jgi:hypothetical protein
MASPAARPRASLEGRRRGGEPIYQQRQAGLDAAAQMQLAQMLGLTNDQLLGKLYGETQPMPRVLPLPARGASASSNPNSSGIEQAHAEVKRAIEHLQELMPDATVTVTTTYRGQ